MPNWGDIAERIARGMYGQQWAQEDKQKQDLAESALRMELARSNEDRQAKRFMTEEEAAAYEKSQRPAKEKRYGAETEGIETRNKQGKNELDVFEATGGAQGAASRLTAEEKRKANADEREGQRVKLEGRRVSVAESAAEESKQTREIRDQLLQTELLNKRAELAVKTVADPGLSMLIQSLQRQHSDLLRSGQPEEAAKVRDQLNAVLDRYAEVGKHMQEAQRSASNPLLGLRAQVYTDRSRAQGYTDRSKR